MKNVLLFTFVVILGLVVSGCKNSPEEQLLDLDGDGWTNSSEDECGTASLDPTDVPTDTDGDLVCDAVDEDDDGDGYSDQSEVVCGSDPQDYTSIPVDLDNDGYCSMMDPDDNDPSVGQGATTTPGGLTGGGVSTSPGGPGGMTSGGVSTSPGDPGGMVGGGSFNFTRCRRFVKFK